MPQLPLEVHPPRARLAAGPKASGGDSAARSSAEVGAGSVPPAPPPSARRRRPDCIDGLLALLVLITAGLRGAAGWERQRLGLRGCEGAAERDRFCPGNEVLKGQVAAVACRG